MRLPRVPCAALMALVLAAPAALAQENPEGMMIHDPYARVVGGIGASGAVYFTLHNHSENDIHLTGVSTDLAEMAGLHTSLASADGMMQMIAIEGGVAMPAWAEHVFGRGGDHIMLMGLTKALKDGDTISVTLTFDYAAPLTFDAVIDNARLPEAAMDHDHSAMTPSP